ncbi:MAG TPA: hypothetical protein VFV70_01315 [Hyphomonadaceae bacterium]|nr:hypothetical protein [Hyphomonadaceae bacterium]
MTVGISPETIRALVALAIEIGDLREKLAAAAIRLEKHSALAVVDKAGVSLIDAAQWSSRDLAAMSSALLRRIDTDGLESVLKHPLNVYEAAHLETARRNADAIDDCCAPRDRSHG